MIDKSKAVALRLQGHTYKDIAIIVGCSEAWCKKELKGVLTNKGSYRDSTKTQAITILEDALEKLRNING